MLALCTCILSILQSADVEAFEFRLFSFDIQISPNHFPCWQSKAMPSITLEHHIHNLQRQVNSGRTRGKNGRSLSTTEINDLKVDINVLTVKLKNNRRHRGVARINHLVTTDGDATRTEVRADGDATRTIVTGESEAIKVAIDELSRSTFAALQPISDAIQPGGIDGADLVTQRVKYTASKKALQLQAAALKNAEAEKRKVCKRAEALAAKAANAVAKARPEAKAEAKARSSAVTRAGLRGPVLGKGLKVTQKVPKKCFAFF